MVDKTPIPLQSPSKFQIVLLDTGTNPTYLPPTTVEGIYSKLQGGYCSPSSVYDSCYFNCTYYQTHRFPEIKLPWSSSGKDTRWIKVNTAAGVFYSAGDTNNPRCVGTIQRSSLSATSSVYGTAVYKSVFFMFDGGKNGDGSDARVGIAPYKNSSSGGSTTTKTSPTSMATRRPVSPATNPSSIGTAIDNYINAGISKAKQYVSSIVVKHQTNVSPHIN